MVNTHLKTEMLEAVQRMESIVDNYYGQNLQRELAQLRNALESGDDVEIDDAISETVDGCASAIDELRSLNNYLISFEIARDQIQSELNKAIKEFEKSL